MAGRSSAGQGTYVSLIAFTSNRHPQSTVRIRRPNERRSLSRSATRALDVLELFGEVRHPLRAIEVAKTLEMHPSTTNQLLKTMVESAHLVFDARTKTYLPSSRLAGFGAWIVETYGNEESLRRLIRDIQSQTDMVITLTTPNDLFMQVVDLALPEGQTTERGMHVSVFGTAIGSAYLSMLDDAELARLIHRARVPTANIPEVVAGVARIRRDGYADGSSTGDGIWSVAMPLPGGVLSVPTVLGLAGPEARVRDNLSEILEIMRQAVDRWIKAPTEAQ
jgi:DNA-binding IclR family transcriptional regulator